MTPETRDALLVAIAKSRGWIEDLRQEGVATLRELADREGGHGVRALLKLGNQHLFGSCDVRRKSLHPIGSP